MPDRLSVADSDTFTLPFTQLFDVPLMPVAGAVLSMLTAGALVAVVLLPAMSLTERVTVWSLPSPLRGSSAGHAPAAIPEPPALSEQVQWIVTLPLYQPFVPLGWVVGAPDKVGGVVSLAEDVSEVVAVLPALSVAVPLTVTPPATVLLLVLDPSARHVSMPDA